MAPATKSSPAPSLTDHIAAGGASCAEQLTDLRARVKAASARQRAARRTLDTGRFDVAAEVTADLIHYRDSIDFRRPDATPVADRPARERELTDQLLDAVRARGLTLTVIGGNGGAVAIVDPRVTREYNEAGAEVIALNKEIETLEREHGADLEAERKRADAARIKEALSSDDGDAIREALLPSLPDQPTAFTTRDLPRRTRGI